MNEAELRQLITQDEAETLEFKQSLLSRKDIAEYAVGIGNSGGGWLIQGVTDARPRRIAGIPEPSVADLQRIRDAVLDATGIRLETHVVPTQDGTVLAIEIPRRPRGHIFSTRTGKYLMRSGEGLRGMTLTEIDEIRRTELAHDDFLAEPVGRPWREVLDPLELERLHQVVTENGRSDLARLEEDELLRALELLHRSGGSESATRAAVLLLGRQEAIREHVPWHEVKLQRYGRDELTPIFNEDSRRPLLAVLQRAAEVIEVVNASPLARIDPLALGKTDPSDDHLFGPRSVPTAPSR